MKRERSHRQAYRRRAPPRRAARHGRAALSRARTMIDIFAAADAENTTYAAAV